MLAEAEAEVGVERVANRPPCRFAMSRRLCIPWWRACCSRAKLVILLRNPASHDLLKSTPSGLELRLERSSLSWVVVLASCEGYAEGLFSNFASLVVEDRRKCFTVIAFALENPRSHFNSHELP